MFAGKALRCDCGYEVRAYDDADFVDAIRRHAREAHGIDLPIELALTVARRAQLVVSGEHSENGVLREENQ